MPAREYSGKFRDTIKVDEVDANTTYVGKAKPGTATSSSAWQVMRVARLGSITSTEFAAGSAEYIHVWDNRATFSYS